MKNPFMSVLTSGFLIALLATGCGVSHFGTSTSTTPVAPTTVVPQPNFPVNPVSPHPVRPTPPSTLANPNWVADPSNYSQTDQVIANTHVSVPILEYHEAQYIPGNIATLKPGQFLEEVQWLHSHGFQTINFGQLYAALYHGYKLPEKPIILSFDDGYESIYSKVFPILQQYHDQATLFVVSGFTHNQPNRSVAFPTLTSDELKTMQQSGLVDIEDHTMTHANLATLSDAAVKRELDVSAAALEQVVHHPMKFFCFPDGGYTTQTTKLVQKAGYLLAVTQHQGYATFGQGPFQLHRVTVLETTSLADFARKLQESFQDVSTHPTVATPSRLDLQVIYQQGVKAFANHDYLGAIQFEQQVISADPTFEPAYNLKGIAQCFAGQFGEGMANIDKALQLNPKSGYARFNRALALELAARYDEAITQYKQAIALQTQDWWVAWSYYGLASIYGRRGDVQSTVSDLQKAMALNPETQTMAKSEPDFNNVRNSTAFQRLINKSKVR